MRFVSLSTILLAVVGCGEAPKSAAQPAAIKSADTFTLMLKLSGALKSNDWPAIYGLHSEVFRKAVGRDMYLSIIESSGLEVFDVRNRKSSRDDLHGYLVFDVDFQTRTQSRHWGAEVVFVSNDQGGWCIMNFPIESISGLNFGVIPEMKKGPNQPVDTTPVSAPH